MSAPPTRRPNGRVIAADPSKALTRTRRRILLYLSRGGRLRKQFCRDLKDHKIDSRDPERYFWILEPMPAIVWRGNMTRERRVSREVIESMQERGYLRRRFAEPDEIVKADLAISPEELADLFSRTDWNGNWIAPRLGAIVQQARAQGRTARKGRKD